MLLANIVLSHQKEFQMNTMTDETARRAIDFTAFGPDADFSPFYGQGVIALDACTAVSGFVNCIVIED